MSVFIVAGQLTAGASSVCVVVEERMRVRGVVAVAAVVSIVPVGIGQAKPKPPVVTRDPSLKPKDPAAAARIARQDEAVRLINLADATVRSRYAVCKPDIKEPEQGFSDADPDPALIAQLAALRRPANEEDLAAEAQLESRPGFRGMVYRRYTRVLHTAGGKTLELSIAQGGFVFTPPPAVCAERRDRILDRLLRRASRPVRRTTRRILRHLRREEQRAPQAPHDGVYVFSFDASGSGGGGGGGDARSFAKFGNFISSGGGKEAGTQLTGVVPDGVASITLRAPKVVARGNFKPLRFKQAYERTVAVHENAVSVHIPRPIDATIGVTQLWRDATGTVIHTVHPPR